MTINKQNRISQIISKGNKRNDVYNLIPEKSDKIIDIGYGDGALVLRLKKEKKCTNLYGIEVNPAQHQAMEGLIDGNWCMKLGDDNNHLDKKYEKFFNWIIMHYTYPINPAQTD